MKLKEIRERSGMTQRQAALGLNLSPVVYGRYENGVREPSNLMLVAMANFFGVTVDEILGREEITIPEDHPARTIEAKILSEGIDRMPAADRERALLMMRLMFAEYSNLFERNDADGTEKP